VQHPKHCQRTVRISKLVHGTRKHFTHTQTFSGQIGQYPLKRCGSLFNSPDVQHPAISITGLKMKVSAAVLERIMVKWPTD